MKTYYIYKLTNQVNGKIYIGCHKTDDLNDGYMGSGKMIRRAKKKHGEKNFAKEILSFHESEEAMFAEEARIVNAEFLARDDVYNIAPGGFGGDRFTYHPDKEQIRDWMKSRIGDKNPMFGKTHSEESLAKIRANKKGQRKGIPTWNKGIELSSEHRQHLSESLTGSGNPRARKFQFISPTKEEFLCCGSLDEFCRAHQLPGTTARYYVDKGVIPEPRGKRGPLRDNLTGWEIKAALRQD